MAYAILQKELVPPDVEALKRACRALPSLHAIDAQTMFNDAYGILTKGLEQLDASVFRDALQAEGIDTLVLEESELPVIPPPKVIRQIQFREAQLEMIDPMGRVFPLPWQDILLVAAGNVRISEFKKVKSSLEEPQFYGSGISYDTVSNTKSREEAHYHLMLEIILAGRVSRYSITADHYDFGLVDGHPVADVVPPFRTLVKELTQFAPHAGLNRGAYLLAQASPELFSYPNKAAYFEELVWMLWRISQVRAPSNS